MGEKKKRQNDAAELDALYRQIEHAKNEDIAIKAIEIARYWLNKADRQTVQIQNLERRNNGGKELPSAQPEPKKGKWISLDDSRGKYNDYGYKCSECGEHSEYEENYCPNCGARMDR